MSQNVIRYHDQGRTKWGVLKNGVVFPLKQEFPTLRAFLAEGGREEAQNLSQSLPSQPLHYQWSTIEPLILSPITDPCTVICQGKNYVEHILETGGSVDGHATPPNVLFTKASSSIAPAIGKLVRPPGVQLLDYEIELGLVIGAPLGNGVKVNSTNLHKYLAGIFIANDISAREVQIREGQWFRAKSYRGFLPAGPLLVLLDSEDIEKLSDLNLKLSVNGEIRQESSTSKMIHRPSETLTLIAETTDLSPGDIVLTGTPAGVAIQVPSGLFSRLAGAFFSPTFLQEKFIKKQLHNTRYLKTGDEIRATIKSTDGTIDLGEQRLQVD